MAEYVCWRNVEDALEKFRQEQTVSKYGTAHDCKVARNAIRQAQKALEWVPFADVSPVVHGRWEYIPQTLNTLSQLRCPFCGWWSLDPSIDGVYNYCPNCGARMDGDKNATD